jgi:photosystem II stability/assembly factor-like uncharacterized protein
VYDGSVEGVAVSRRPLAALCIVVAISLAAPAGAAAAVNAWSTGAQEGGKAASVALAGSRAFAGIVTGGSGGGVLRSGDGGATWTRLSSFGYREVQDLAIDPAPGQPVYAATRTGIVRSLDNGASWAEIAGAGDGPGQFYDGVAVDNGKPGTAFFLRSAGAGGGVWRTTNGGAGFWTSVSGGLGVLPFLTGIVVDPNTHAAWGWRTGVGVFVLVDGATTWTLANAGLPNLSVEGVAVDVPGHRVIAVTTNGSASLPGIGGPSWTALNGGAITSTLFLTVTADAGGTVYANLLSGPLARLASGATIWAADGNGLPTGVSTPGMAGDATVAGHAIMRTGSVVNEPNLGQGPLWRTVNGGTLWTRAGSGFDAVNVEDLAAGPGTPHLLLAATQADAVQRSTDGGATWSANVTGLTAAEATGVAFDGGPGVAYATTNGSGVFRSIDSGTTWSPLAGSAAATFSIATDRSRPGTVFVGGGGATVFKSANAGGTWAALPVTGLTLSFIDELVADPDAPGAIYAVGGAGVFHLADGGGTWQARTTGLAGLGVESIAFDPRSQAMLAATDGGGVYRSLNRGATWSVASNGVADSFVNGVVYDPQVTNMGYASTNTGVYRTTDGGTTWAPLTGGLALPSVSALRFDADGRTLYGATHAIGVVARTRGVLPVATKRPAVTGTARAGRTLTGAVGVWDGTPTPALTRAWQRCNSKGTACVAIGHATAATYRIVGADAGHTLRLAVTGKSSFGSATSLSLQTARVTGAPSVAKTPKVAGTARVGKRLRVTFTVFGFPTPKVTVRWLRCNARGAHCVTIRRATARTYKLASADKGHRVRVAVTLRNKLGKVVVRSAVTRVVG